MPEDETRPDTSGVGSNETAKKSVEKAGSNSPNLEPGSRADPADLLVEAVGQISLQQMQAAFVERFKGPLPHPDHFAAYEEIMPGSAERILALAERQASHRHTIELKAVEAGIRVRTQGQWMAFVLSTITIGGGVFLIGMGQPVEGAATALTALAALVGLFVWSKKQERDERSEDLTSSAKKQPPTRESHGSGSD